MASDQCVERIAVAVLDATDEGQIVGLGFWCVSERAERKHG
jgi:hypothetical protein